MDANTVYQVFLALPIEEREKFIVLVKEQELKVPFNLKKKENKKPKYFSQDTMDYLLATVFKPKN